MDLSLQDFGPRFRSAAIGATGAATLCFAAVGCRDAFHLMRLCSSCSCTCRWSWLPSRCSCANAASQRHGGQVQLPLLGPLLTLSRVPRSWAKGRAVALDDDRTLVVSRGIGMERGYAPRSRFLCCPQLVVLDVIPAAHSVPLSVASPLP